MEDFRVGSVPSTDPYGHPDPGANPRKRKRPADVEPEDTFVLQEAEEEPIQDSYTPSAQREEE